jgi:TolA-binding protein/LysM repeat protein
MNQFKKFFYLVGVVVAVVVLMYGYFIYKGHGLKNEFSRAKSSYEAGDVIGAINILEEVYKKTPGSETGKEAAYLLGKSYINVNELEKAEKYWNILLGVDKEKYGDECLYNLGIIAKSTNRPDEAIRYYEQLVEQYPNSGLADDAMMNLALVHKDKGEIAEAQKELMKIIETNPQSNLISTVEDELGKINIDLLGSVSTGEGATEHIVKSGDSLFVIAQKYGTTVELIKKTNSLKSDFIKPGDKLKIITDKFSVIVDKSKNILTLKAGEKVVKVYRVGTGVSGCTPVGTFTITNKLVNPPWHKPGSGVVPFGDKSNVLGTRWMGFNKTGYGIHGTWEPESIGQQASAGCVRLVNKDCEELYEIVPVGTEVTIIE